MSKRKTFRRVKVSNRGYVSGKRLQMFHATEKKSPASAGNAGGGGDGKITDSPVSYDSTRAKEKQV